MPLSLRLAAICACMVLALSASACARTAPAPVPAPAAAPPRQVESPEQAAQRSAEAWLGLVDRGQYGASWDSAAATFRQAVMGPQWREAVLTARGPFEPFGARRLLSRQYTTSLPNAPPGEYVVLQYETEVRGGRRVVETVVPTRDPDGRWRVSGYFVRPQ
jgi:hypothetical protein